MHGLGCKLSSATVIYLRDFRVVGFNEAFPLCIFSYEVQQNYYRDSALSSFAVEISKSKYVEVADVLKGN